MADIVLASSLDGKDHLVAWDKLFEMRFAALELEKILIMMIDTVDYKALPYLADQFDLLGVKGWNACKSDQDRRNLIKRAIELKRYQGTNYAIRRALQSVGYYDAEVHEGVGARYDGKFKHDGFIQHGGGQWACFAVTLDLGEKKGISPSETSGAIDLINEYKRAACKLLYVDYKCTLLDTVQVREAFVLVVEQTTIEDVDPITDELTTSAVTSPAEDNFNTADDGGMMINFVNLAGDIIEQDNF